jgi:hypothetical protein
MPDCYPSSPAHNPRLCFCSLGAGKQIEYRVAGNHSLPLIAKVHDRLQRVLVDSLFIHMRLR